MSRTTKVDAAAAAVANAKSVADGPTAKAALRRIKEAAATRSLWMPGRHGRRPVPMPEPPPTPSDREVTLALVDHLGQRAARALARPLKDNTDGDARSKLAAPLPHALVTDRNLAHFLARAGESSEAIARRGAPTGPRLATEAYVDQTTANDAVVNCLHQLDHRTTDHRLQLERLESMVSELLRRLDRIETLTENAARSRPDTDAASNVGRLDADIDTNADIDTDADAGSETDSDTRSDHPRITT